MFLNTATHKYSIPWLPLDQPVSILVHRFKKVFCKILEPAFKAKQVAVVHGDHVRRHVVAHVVLGKLGRLAHLQCSGVVW